MVCAPLKKQGNLPLTRADETRDHSGGICNADSEFIHSNTTPPPSCSQPFSDMGTSRGPF